MGAVMNSNDNSQQSSKPASPNSPKPSTKLSAEELDAIAQQIGQSMVDSINNRHLRNNNQK
jgi:hypothetical protein